MNDILFCKSFRFNEFNFHETQHRDNSQGIDLHYIGRVRHGSGRIVCDNQILDIQENEMVYIPKGCKYRSDWIAQDYVHYDSIGFLYFPTEASNGYKLQKIDYDAAIWDAFHPLSNDKAVTATSIGTLYHLLGLLEKKLEPAPGNADSAIYEKLLLTIKDNPYLSIPQYAALCNVSESLLYHYVKRSSGKTPNRLRQEILCEKASELLYTTSDTIEEICCKLGFSSAAYFRKVFYSVFHTTPSQMRKKDNVI